MVEGKRILAYGRYSYVDAGRDTSLRPCVRLDYLARDLTAEPGTGTEMFLRLLVRISKDPRAHAAKGILVDSLNCGDTSRTRRRWDFFTRKLGFVPLVEDEASFGYAFLPMPSVDEIVSAIRA